MLRSLAEVVSSRQPVTGVVLRASKDLLCTNLFCEKVSEPCICRLDRVLQMKKMNSVKVLDLSNNKLNVLPPSLSELRELEELDVSGNCLSEIPPFVLSLPKLKVLWVSGNTEVKLPSQAAGGDAVTCEVKAVNNS